MHGHRHHRTARPAAGAPSRTGRSGCAGSRSDQRDLEQETGRRRRRDPASEVGTRRRARPPSRGSSGPAFARGQPPFCSCYPGQTTFHRLGEMGAWRPFFLRRPKRWRACTTRRRTLEREISGKVEEALPGVEVLAVELTGPERMTVYVDRAERARRHRALRARHAPALRLPARVRRRRLLARAGAAAAQAGALPARARPPGEAEDRRPQAARRGHARGRRPRDRGRRRRRVRHPVRPDRAGQPDRGDGMSREIIELVHELERDRGIEGDTLIAALEDALLAAYKKTPGASRHAVVELDGRGRLPRLLDRAPAGHRGAAARGGARARAHRARGRRGRERRALARARHRRGPRHRLVRGAREPGQAGRRHARELRPHRRADREAGHHAADPRGRAPDHVRRVRRPRDRGRDRDRPAGRRPQQRAGRPRQGRGAAAALRAGRRRALRAGLAHQGRHHRGPQRHQGPAGDPRRGATRS